MTSATAAKWGRFVSIHHSHLPGETELMIGSCSWKNFEMLIIYIAQVLS